ncbi:MAG: WecB/TagA/CpsF family glycosyltransferase [Chthoniobacterales bacterium]
MTTIPIIGTPLAVTTYAELQTKIVSLAEARSRIIIDFTNTQIAVARRHEPMFREITSDVDWFIPDGMPLIWAMNARGAGLKDRVYGPSFMRHSLSARHPTIRHFFLGGSNTCLDHLIAHARRLNPDISIVGTHNGYFPESESPRIIEIIRASNADFIWVGLGTPKQQEWLHRHRGAFDSGVFLAVGFAFDVNAGTKSDAPDWMQRYGLTWLFRFLSEPVRLGPRYLKYNPLFCWYLLREEIRRRSYICRK